MNVMIWIIAQLSLILSAVVLYCFIRIVVLLYKSLFNNFLALNFQLENAQKEEKLAVELGEKLANRVLECPICGKQLKTQKVSLLQ